MIKSILAQEKAFMEKEVRISAYPLSPMQAGMLFQSLYRPGRGLDIEQLVCRCKGVDIDALKFAWEQLLQTHDVLRTGFDWQESEQPLQSIYQEVSLPWRVLDWRDQPGDPQRQLDDFLRQDRFAGFKLDQPPLLRLTLLQARDGHTWLIWTYHHILLDGRALPLIIRQMAQAYQARRQGESVTLRPSRSYREYITWLEEQDWSGAKAYWKEIVKQVQQHPTPLGVSHPQLPIPADERDYDFLKSSLSPELTDALKQFTLEHSLTLNTIMQGAWAILLSRYSGEQDILFGTIRTGRRSALNGHDTGEMVGLLINTLPVRVQVAPQSQALQVLKALRASSLELRGTCYEHVSLAEIQKMSQLQPGSRLFESILGFDNLGFDEVLKSQHPMLADWEFALFEHIGYPLVMMAYGGDQVKLSLEYSRELFDSATAGRILGHFQVLLQGIVNDPCCTVSTLPILTEAERLQLLVEWNDTGEEYPRDECIHELFEAQAERTPGAVAVMFQDQQLTYFELNQRANQLAHYLHELGIGPGTLVGICFERSLEMVVGLLGILKAGGVYVPLDPAFPAERLAFMLKDSGVKALLTQDKLLPFLKDEIPLDPDVTIICLDNDWDQIVREPFSQPISRGKPAQLAYVLYTSGSTNKPKGVQICHSSVVNFLHSMTSCPGITSADTLLAVTTLSFDIAGLELFLPLSAGAKLVIAPAEATLDGYQLDRLLRETNATLMQATPATWQLLLACGWAGKPDLRILCGGEALPNQLAVELLPRCAELWNLYGPTETTIWSTIEPVTTGRAFQTIGRPIVNTQVYLLDAYLQLVPIGVLGEICIGGAGLARSYLNQPELTAEKFISNPFGVGRVYKTGDLGRYLPDGNIEFLGRTDYQVKIRGFRIELGEIETALGEHPSVQKVVVVARPGPGGEGRLVAYLCLHNAVHTTDEIPSVLRDYLKRRLPDYMLPSAFVILEQLPLTQNGKIDRKALPDPEFTFSSGEQFISPETPTEETLAGFWTEILGVEKIGANDNFFDLGGHSLLATRLFVRIRESFGLELPLRLLFEAPRLTDLAKRIENVVWAAQQNTSTNEDDNANYEEMIL